MVEKIQKSEEDWRRELTPEAYQVCRMKGTERPFSGAYNDSKKPGVFVCACCGNALFDSDTKYDSGTGWPSFWAPAAQDAVETKTDGSLFMRRTEVLCAACDSHLGHVFDDGPAPTGQRYCLNSVALKLIPRNPASDGDQ